jgi:hypothetical protein
MEEHVIQDTPVASSDQPVAAADTAPQQPDPALAVKAEYETQLAALKQQATEAEERF